MGRFFLSPGHYACAWWFALYRQSSLVQIHCRLGKARPAPRRTLVSSSFRGALHLGQVGPSSFAMSTSLIAHGLQPRTPRESKTAQQSRLSTRSCKNYVNRCCHNHFTFCLRSACMARTG
jgi:hypothetical protein